MQDIKQRVYDKTASILPTRSQDSGADSKWSQILVWRDNDLKYSEPREPHHIWILSIVLDHIIDLKQKTDEILDYH